ncbi:hypothetical protein GCM10023144_01900 [Pigmentiphaga soli]|uniref:Alpha/beta hydrolase n=1 Tax=Pigmentiphaga soli TaxID=1007095 RepID=A0ABP8GDM8_9BURK
MTGLLPYSAKHLAAAAVLLSLCCGSARGGERIEAASPRGIAEPLFVDGAPSPAWAVVLFAGHDGALDLDEAGPRRLRGNFLVRTQGYWAGAGMAAALFDAPADHAAGMPDTFRLSDAARQDVAAAVALLRARYPAARIALMGTSRGTVTVGNVLARDPALADAYVMTSPVTVATRSQPGLSGMHWRGGLAQVLVLANENDGCSVSPFAAARGMARRNGFDFRAVSSARSDGKECGGGAPHGFAGIEPQVLDTVRDWLAGVSAGRL